MKNLLVTFAIAIVATNAMLISIDTQADWWDDDDDYWDRPWYGGGPWYGGYPYGGYGGYPYGGYGGYPYGGYPPYGGGYGGYPYGGYGGYPQTGYADPSATTDATTPADQTTTPQANPAYPTYYGY